MRNTLPHLLVSYDNTLSEGLIKPFTDTFRAAGLDVLVESRPPTGPQAGLHWLFPTTVIIYITKSYFEGYLTEAGKEHYQCLKRALGSLWSSFFGNARAVRGTIITSKGKSHADYQQYSIAISVVAEAGEGLRFKLMFEDEGSAAEFNLAVASFLEFLRKYYAGQLDPATQARLSDTRHIGKTILATYEKTIGEFVFLDPTRPQWYAAKAARAET